VDLVDMKILWSNKRLKLSGGLLGPHPFAWLALEMKNHRKFRGTILGDQMAILLIHGVSVSRSGVANVHTNRPVFWLGRLVRCTCILRLVGQATSKNACKIVRRRTMKAALCV
jgi:hypothetical protein